MEAATQLAVFLNNKPGTLARLCQTLADEKINIWAISTSDTIDHSVVRLVVDEPKRALRLLEEHGTLVVDNDVIMIEGDNRSGSLAQIAAVLAKHNINIEYCYCATQPRSSRGLMIVRPDNVPKAVKYLNLEAGLEGGDNGKPGPKPKKAAKAAPARSETPARKSRGKKT